MVVTWHEGVVNRWKGIEQMFNPYSPHHFHYLRKIVHRNILRLLFILKAKNCLGIPPETTIVF